MKFGSVEDLKKAGFKGFMPVWMLKSAGISSDDAIANNELDRPGVYMVVRTDDSEPVFVPEGSGGHFKGRNPNVRACRTLGRTLYLAVGRCG